MFRVSAPVQRRDFAKVPLECATSPRGWRYSHRGQWFALGGTAERLVFLGLLCLFDLCRQSGNLNRERGDREKGDCEKAARNKIWRFSTAKQQDHTKSMQKVRPFCQPMELPIQSFDRAIPVMPTTTASTDSVWRSQFPTSPRTTEISRRYSSWNGYGMLRLRSRRLQPSAIAIPGNDF